MPKLTFIVTTHKRPELLLRCVTSIKTFVKIDHEIIVVDDSADGEGFSVAASVGASYIKKSRFDRRGQARSRNLGIDLAKGEFIVFIDDDDFLVGEAIESMVLGAEAHDFLCANYFFYSKENLHPVNIEQFSMDEMLVFNRIPVGSFAIRRSKIVYGFDEEMRSHEDWDFLLRNLSHLKVKYFNLFPVAIDKTNDQTSSHQGLTRKLFWIDYLSVYSRFPCPRLKHLRHAKLQSMGVSIGADLLECEPSVNQRVF